MLPALAEIVSNVVGLQLAPDTTAAVLGAVLAPLLRSGPDADPASEDPPKIRRAGQPRLKSRSAPRRRRKESKRRASRPTEARDRALAALKANPDATVARIAKLAKCSLSTVVNARKDLAAEARKSARKTAGEAPKLAPADRRQRAKAFLQDALAHGPQLASAIEEAASRAHIHDLSLEQARTALGVVTSRANTGEAQAVQWSLPG